MQTDNGIMPIALTARAGKDKMGTTVRKAKEAKQMEIDYKEGCKRMLDKIIDERILKKIYNLIAIYYAKA